MNKKLTILDIKNKKQKQEKITMLTAYDYAMASAIDASDIDMILVGDSLGMVVLGYESTKKVTMSNMIHHCKAVSRAVKKAIIVADMPFLSYNVSIKETVYNAGRFIKEADCDAVKLEGGLKVCDSVKAISEAGIPVLGHIGLTPQTASILGGFKVQGKDLDKAIYLIKSALALENAGCFGLVLECIPSKLSEIITEKINIPTIGIGAGSCCDGQVLVTHDLLGMSDKFKPRFVKQYNKFYELMKEAFNSYKKDIIEGKFPGQEHEFKIPKDTLKQVKKFVFKKGKNG